MNNYTTAKMKIQQLPRIAIEQEKMKLVLIFRNFNRPYIQFYQNVIYDF